MQSLRWRIIIALTVLVLGLAYMLPSIPGVQGSSLAKFLPGDSINLGLDLKGGIHLTLGVDVDTALKNNLDRIGNDLKSVAKDEDIYLLRPTVLPGDRFQVVLLKGEQREKFEQIVKDSFESLMIDGTEAMDDGRIRYVFSITSEYRQYFTKMTMEQAIKTIRNRIDQFGVAEPDIRRQEDNRIQIQLPGIQDPERAINLIGRTAHLEFKMVDETAGEGAVPPGSSVYQLQRRLPNGTYAETPIVLKKETVLTGEYITNAYVSYDGNVPYVGINFDNKGSRIFERLTGDNVGNRMAIVLDGKVYSAPTIQDRISGGRASITGHFTDEEARDLAVVLRAGSLPAPINILEQRTVGPSLGQESIDKGIQSAYIGMIAVLVFMVIYYGIAGAIADVVLMLNIMLIMGGLAAFGATLTLPGIAGIILTIGMAVDANVIIFERIREELRRGLTSRAAIEEGYAKATLTIFDANVTTVIAAVILYNFGTGPIRGFAVTLTLGIITSMFTAIFVSRILFDAYVRNRAEGAKLSI